MTMLGLVRQFRGSIGLSDPQSPPPSAPPIWGDPADPPTPSNVTFTPPSGRGCENYPSSAVPPQQRPAA